VGEENSKQKELCVEGQEEVVEMENGVFLLMVRRPAESAREESSEASEVYRRQALIDVKKYLRSQGLIE
jgi:hypothetical protein